MVSLGQQTFCSTSPHFFKVILENSSLDLKLKIPKKFVMKYGKDLSNLVCLKLPSGFEWEVELTRCNGKAWFEKGWPEFYSFCSLACGNFLVFRYEGNSTFELCIFDTSCTEIDYPINVSKIDEDEDDDLSIDILDDFSPCLKSREKFSLISPPCKKMRKRSDTISDSISEYESAQPFSTVLFEKPMLMKDSHCSNSESKGEGHRVALESAVRGSSCTRRLPKQTLDHKIIKNALQSASAFNPDDAPFFKISMKTVNIHRSILSLPSKFSKRHLTKLPAGIATLQFSSGRTWSVRTWSVQFKYDHDTSKAQLLNGWSEFVRDNCLKVGDVCGFFLIDRYSFVFEVALPNNEAPNFPMTAGDGDLIIVQEKRSPDIKVESECDLSCEFDLSSSLAIVNKPNISEQLTQRRDRRSNLDAANKFVSDKPFFLATLGSLHKEKSNVWLPAKFVESFIKVAKQTVKLQVEDRSWPVKLFRYGKTSAKFSGGWAAFAKEHQLEKGDVCIFELTERNDIVLKVHIFRC
ncbi:B3 domain-containing transcription factor VRN1-like [Argentina anserina]|uniref:B3 domain-containing transcription factor VRN1-like n=1 Tax=Argentina anserina TaxID=57926 RepID=UPI0021764659|nr:B3 domain-containing transcription factor VRN1-like [Potentilla anserina]